MQVAVLLRAAVAAPVVAGRTGGGAGADTVGTGLTCSAAVVAGAAMVHVGGRVAISAAQQVARGARGGAGAGIADEPRLTNMPAVTTVARIDLQILALARAVGGAARAR